MEAPVVGHRDDQNRATAAPRYHAPRLVVYGRLRELTAAGSGLKPEPGQGVPPPKSHA
jgi:hypothetical protein